VSNTEEYRLVGGSHRSHRDGERYAAGETMVPTEGELEAFPKRFEEMEQAETFDEEEVEDPRTTDEQTYDGDNAEAIEEIEFLDSEQFHAEEFTSRHWAQVRDDLESGEYDEYLDEIESSERDRDSPRQNSVLDTIEERREAPVTDSDEE